MAATVNIKRWTGAVGSPTKTSVDGANTVANAVDSHQAIAAGSSNTIKIPKVGTNYSYWVTTRLNAGSTPAGSINNLRWYGDGAANWGTGVGCIVGQVTGINGANTNYVQATGTPGTTGDLLNVTNHPNLIDLGSGDRTRNFDTYTSGSPMSVSGSISNPNTGDFGNFVVYQLTVGTTASAGVTAQETFTWLYDET